MMRWIAGLVAVLLLPACGDGPGTQLSTVGDGNEPVGNSPGLSTGQPPSVIITNPETGASIPEGSTITVEAVATNPNAAIARVEFYEDNRLIGSKSTPPYRISYGPLRGGSHLLCAAAIDIHGIALASAPITLFVVQGNRDGKGDDHKGQR
jgi:Bacterial Ig domain